MGKRQPAWKQTVASRNEELEEKLQHHEQTAKLQYYAFLAIVAVVLVAALVQYTFSLQGAEQRAASELNAVPGIPQDRNGYSPLHKAAQKGVEPVKELLENPLYKEKGINQGDKWSETPIFKAARAGLHNTVEVLLEHGADPNAMSKKQKSPLYVALFDSKDKVKNDDGQRTNTTALALIRGGADVNVTLKEGSSLLHVALEEPNLTVIQFLIEQKVELDRLGGAMGRSALHLASVLPTEEHAALCLQKLLEAGAKVNMQDRDAGHTPLHEAVIMGHVKAVELLLLHGADATIAEGMLGRTPLDIAKKKKRDEIVQLIEKHSVEDVKRNY